jgi:hypothetical protein
MLWSLLAKHDFWKLKNHIATWTHAFMYLEIFQIKKNPPNLEWIKFTLFHHVVAWPKVKENIIHIKTY